MHFNTFGTTKKLHAYIRACSNTCQSLSHSNKVQNQSPGAYHSHNSQNQSALSALKCCTKNWHSIKKNQQSRFDPYQNNTDVDITMSCNNFVNNFKTWSERKHNVCISFSSSSIFNVVWYPEYWWLCWNESPGHTIHHDTSTKLTVVTMIYDCVWYWWHVI